MPKYYLNEWFFFVCGYREYLATQLVFFNHIFHSKKKVWKFSKLLNFYNYCDDYKECIFFKY